MAKRPSGKKKKAVRRHGRVAKHVAQVSRHNKKHSLASWCGNHAPGVIVAIRFTLLAAGLYTLLFVPFHHALLDSFSGLIAVSANQLIHLLGESPLRDGSTILSYRFSVDVAAECTGAETLCVLTAAIALTPLGWGKRFLGILLVTTSMLGINSLRITSLYMTGVHDSEKFALLHEKIWPIIMTPLAVLIFLGWLITSIPDSTDPLPCS